MAYYRCLGAERRDEQDQPACDYEQEKPWFGRCPQCHQPFGHRRYGAEKKKQLVGATLATKVKEMERHKTGVDHFDAVIGGGLVLGKTSLFGGTRGVGKTTLLLQLCNAFASKARPVLYASAEEDDETIIQMAQRAGITNPYVHVMGHARDLRDQIKRTKELKVWLWIVDSLQELYDGPGMDGGRNERGIGAMHAIEEHSRRHDIASLVINHMTKSNDFVGSTNVEHYITGALLMLMNYNAPDDGSLASCMPNAEARLVKADNVKVLLCHGKNRIGPADEKRFFEMTGKGLRQIAPRPKLSLLATPRGTNASGDGDED